MDENKASWYDPHAWPDIVRWLALLPVTILVAIVVNIIVTFVNSLDSYIPSGLVSLGAAAIAAYWMSYVAKHTAPTEKTAVAVSVVIMVAIFCACLIALELRGDFKSGTPLWFDVTYVVAAVGGAIAGAVAPAKPERVRPSRPSIPELARWLALLPCAAVASVGSILITSIAGVLLRLPPEIVRAENGFLMIAVFLSVAGMIAPRGSRWVMLVLATIPLTFALAYFSAGIMRPIVLAIIEHIRPGSLFGFYEPPWQQSIEGVAMLFGVVIPLGASFAKRPQTIPIQVVA
jgi:uncharacterized membrane protein